MNCIYDNISQLTYQGAEENGSGGKRKMRLPPRHVMITTEQMFGF